MGARAMQTKARTWLESAKDHGVVAQKMAATEEALINAQSKLDEQAQTIAELTARLDALEPPKRGRRKEAA